MAVMPNGQAADLESIGSLFQTWIKILASLHDAPSLTRMSYLRRCLNALRSGDRLKVRQNQATPNTEETVKGEDWLRLARIQEEFLRTWTDSRVVLDLKHTAWCLDQLAQGLWLETDLAPNFRPLGEQLDAFEEYDDILRAHLILEIKGFRAIANHEFRTVREAVELGIFSPGDLLLYCYNGDTPLTAEIARGYINIYASGVYATNEPIINPGPELKDTSMRMVSESDSSRAFPRPDGFYVMRLPEFAEGGRFGTGRDFADFKSAEAAAAKLCPMSSEAFQLFGITHKCRADLRRPAKLALPGFLVKEWDTCHIGGEGWDQTNRVYREQNTKNMLTIGHDICLGLGTLCQRTSQISQEIGFGFLAPWQPAREQPLRSDAACSTCKKPLYFFDGLSVCSFCGHIKRRD